MLPTTTVATHSAIVVAMLSPTAPITPTLLLATPTLAVLAPARILGMVKIVLNAAQNTIRQHAPLVCLVIQITRPAIVNVLLLSIAVETLSLSLE